MTEKNRILGELLKKKRNELGYSLREVAYEMGMSHTELSNIESGERKSINLNILYNLCDYLELDLKELLDNAEYFNKNKEYKVVFRRTVENCVEIESNCLNKVVELVTDISFDLDEILPNINDEIEMSFIDREDGICYENLKNQPIYFNK